MEIGKRIQESRLNAKLTQEHVAETLGVSRQTISNWENGKTYPDIVSVVKMSDLYSVSLDRLLKEEKSMSNYLEYLDESTNAVKSKNKLAKLILVVSYLVIWALALITFWFFTDGADAMGYGFMFLWVLLPITTLVLSILIAKNGYWGKLKWLSAVVFGVMYMLAEYATFSAANMKSFGNVMMPEWGMILGGGIVSAVGLSIGVGISRMKQHKKAENYGK
ncbi:MAG: helix-turn-helix transcriptional regulator [Lachnospiraceae bacterium]|nr:helix-turn-helix transcriptional regulator [Lachnospiraceae bacterium]